MAKQMEEASLPVSTSIGYVTFEKPPVSISEVFDKAESAMHSAEASGESFAVSA
jgi:GGDEF domain-containing protein